MRARRDAEPRPCALAIAVHHVDAAHVARGDGVAIEKTNSRWWSGYCWHRATAENAVRKVSVWLIGLFTLACGASPVRSARRGRGPPNRHRRSVLAGRVLVIGSLVLTTGGALGALVGRQEGGGARRRPAVGMLIAFYIVGQGGAETTLGTILAYVPFAAPMIMPGRIALGASSPFEIVASLAIGVATVLLAGRLSAVVYRRAIVRTGRRLKLRDALRSVPR